MRHRRSTERGGGEWGCGCGCGCGCGTRWGCARGGAAENGCGCGCGCGCNCAHASWGCDLDREGCGCGCGCGSDCGSGRGCDGGYLPHWLERPTHQARVCQPLRPVRDNEVAAVGHAPECFVGLCARNATPCGAGLLSNQQRRQRQRAGRACATKTQQRPASRRSSTRQCADGLWRAVPTCLPECTGAKTSGHDAVMIDVLI